MNKTADPVAYRKAYYLENKQTILESSRRWREANKEKLAEIDREYRMNNPAKALLTSAKARALKRNIPFDIDENDIFIPDVCPILKVPFQYGTEYAMSLDRRDNSKGYVKGNVWVISKKANSMKSNATDDELRAFARWIVFDVG